MKSYKDDLYREFIFSKRNVKQGSLRSFFTCICTPMDLSFATQNFQIKFYLTKNFVFCKAAIV